MVDGHPPSPILTTPIYSLELVCGTTSFLYAGIDGKGILPNSDPTPGIGSKFNYSYPRQPL
jgi:hypothetical protein